MKAHHMTLHDALGKIICTRPTTSPNPGFIRQLKEMERELFDDASTLDVDELPRRKEDRAAMFTEQEKSQTTAKVNVQ